MVVSTSSVSIFLTFLTLPSLEIKRSGTSSRGRRQFFGIFDPAFKTSSLALRRKNSSCSAPLMARSLRNAASVVASARSVLNFCAFELLCVERVVDFVHCGVACLQRARVYAAFFCKSPYGADELFSRFRVCDPTVVARQCLRGFCRRQSAFCEEAAAVHLLLRLVRQRMRHIRISGFVDRFQRYAERLHLFALRVVQTRYALGHGELDRVVLITYIIGIVTLRDVRHWAFERSGSRRR